MSITGDNVLEIVDLCVRVGIKEVLSHINMAIPEGEVHVLLGPNGSGKTSLLMTIMGFPEYVVTCGSLWFKGQDITETPVHERVRMGLAIAQQRPPTVRGITLRALLEYILQNETDSTGRLEELAKASHMETLLDRDVNYGLSGGEIKRSELIQLFALSPEFSLMDEPDSGVDVEALTLMGEIINRHFMTDPVRPVLRKAGLIITHNGNILRQLPIDKAHVMVNGQIGCSGNPNILMQHINSFGYESCIRCMTERKSCSGLVSLER
ncbi:MAG: ABC transporter ATP-binding protein [Sphaerochaetaceae bacterium]